MQKNGVSYVSVHQFSTKIVFRLGVGGFQMMLILSLLGMYFDAVVVFFTISSLLFRMAMAML